jgi:transcriptional regulator with XRE-family HTH domain
MKGRKAALGGLMPERMRNRRDARGISGADLARRVGVSPAYVSQIEKGIRVPDIPVAIRIAHALEDDEALYVAWSRDHRARARSKSPSTPYDDAWTRLYRSDRFDDEASFGQAVASGRDIPPAFPVESRPSASVLPDVPTTIRSPRAVLDSAREPPGTVERMVAGMMTQAREEGRSLVTAPVLEPGKDPGEREEVPRLLHVDEMVIDPRFLPRVRLGRPFVFRADEEVSRRVRDRVEPGDLVVVSRDLDDGAPEPGKVYALRHGGRVFLGRLARFGDRFLVQPGSGETEMTDLGLTVGGPPKPAVAGEVAAVIKGG